MSTDDYDENSSLEKNIPENMLREFRSIKGLKFCPYVGKNYEHSVPRILVVGESHYTDGPEEANVINEKSELSNETIYDVTKGSVIDKKESPCIPYYWWIGQAFPDCLGEKPWESIAFMNKMQWMMNKASGDVEVKKRLKHKNHECQEDNHVFFSVVKVLRPNIVIFYSKKAYDSLPYYDGRDKNLPDMVKGVVNIYGNYIDENGQGITPINKNLKRKGYEYTYVEADNNANYKFIVYAFDHFSKIGLNTSDREAIITNTKAIIKDKQDKMQKTEKL